MEKIFYKEKEYDLAKKTMKIARLQEAAERSSTLTEAYSNEFAFVKAVIGDTAVRDILGTSSLEEINLNELVLLYNEIVTEYDKEIIQAEREREIEALSSPTFEKISKLAEDVKVISDIEKLSKKQK